MLKVRPGASRGGARPTRSLCLQAPAGGSSWKDPWQVSRSPGTQVPQHILTAHPLRRFVRIVVRWATISRIKLDIDYIPGIDNEWTDALSHNMEHKKGFFPPEQRIEFFVNDLLSPCQEPFRVPEHGRWPDQLRKLEYKNAQTLVPHGF